MKPIDEMQLPKAEPKTGNSLKHLIKNGIKFSVDRDKLILFLLFLTIFNTVAVLLAWYMAFQLMQMDSQIVDLIFELKMKTVYK